MTGYYQPDLSGQDPQYRQVNIPFRPYKLNVKLYFDNSPAFEDTLVFTVADGTGLVLVKNTDWKVNNDDVDDSAMNQAFIQDPGFSKRLLKSVTIISSRAVGKLLTATYQSFVSNSPLIAVDDGRPTEITPDAFRALQVGLANAQQQIARVSSPVATTIAAPKLLPFDIQGTKSTNLITGESHDVNTVAGVSVIRPVYGAFFWDSVEISYNGTPLTRDVDYVAMVPSSLTAQTTNTGGIFQYIGISKVVAGPVTINYRAVGGEVQPTDINSVYQLMIAIQEYLDSSIFVTSDTVAATPAVRALDSRTTILEDGMRRILSGSPTYGDSSTGTAVTRPIQSPDADIHWFTIATLYKVTGSTDIVTADQFKGRVYLPDAKINFGFTVDFNMDQPRIPVSCKTDSLVFDPNYTIFTDLDVDTPQIPMLRVVWNQAAQSFSGAALQLGIALPALVDRMVVEDFSSAESCWILNRTNEFIVGQVTTPASTPQDNGFLLPDGLSIWSNSSSISYSRVFAPEYKDGYLAYSGAQVTIGTLTTNASTASNFGLVIPSYFPIETVRTMVVTMQSADAGTVYDVEIPLVYKATGAMTGRQNFTDSDLVAMTMMAELNQDALGDISIELRISEHALPLSNPTPSDKTDLVRYIRVKV